MRLIFLINYYYLIDKLQIFRNILQTIHQLILNYQKLNYLRWYNLGGPLGPLSKTGLPLMKNVIKPLAKSVLISLGLTAAASRADAGIHKKFLDLKPQH